jgi:DNA-binding XRE family transcriptional regulator
VLEIHRQCLGWTGSLVNGVTLTPDQLILHSCDKGGYPVGCGNPAHMRIGTVQQNSDDMMDRQRHGLPKTVVRAIRTLIEQGRTQQEIADLYGVSRETISAIATTRVYKKVE